MPLIDTGRYLFRLEEPTTAVRTALMRLYGEPLAGEPDRPADFRIALRSGVPLRRVLRPQVTFYADRQAPFRPVPRAQAFPMLEWGMNWCIAAHDYTRLLIHAGVVARGGRAVIFPAAPGSGKSTLTAYLAQSGWDLYSDELAIVEPDTLRVAPLFRPVCLKNESIDLIRRWFPDAIMSARAGGTSKGDVAHLAAMDRARFRTLGDATVVGIVFPKYTGADHLTIVDMDGLLAFRQLAGNSFNYGMLGAAAFRTVAGLIGGTRQFELRYGDVAAVDAYLREVFTDA